VEQLTNPLGQTSGATVDLLRGMTNAPSDRLRQAQKLSGPAVTEDPDGAFPMSFLQPSKRSDSLGRLSHYEILEVLGKGAFGTVFRAFDDKLQRVVAIKVMAPELAATSPARKRFLREAQAAAAIRHEHVVSIYAVEETPLPYLVMEYIAGPTLQQRLDQVGPLGVAEVLRLGRQTAEGLQAAHARNLIHRDIKPGNILLEAGVEERVKITDFGLARAVDDASITQSGTIAGTPMYMAPEQALGQKFDQRADLFSLGSVLYQMVSGRPPFRAPSTLAVLKRVVDDTPRPIVEIMPETPDWLSKIISKLHAKNPDDRFQSALEVAKVLAEYEAFFAGSQELKHLPVLPREKAQPVRWRRAILTATLLLPLMAYGVYALAIRMRPVAADRFVGYGVALSEAQADRGKEPRELSSNVEVQPPSRQDDAPRLAVAPFDAEQAKTYQDAWARYLELPVDFTNSLGMQFRLVPPGAFMMGATPEEMEHAISHAEDWNRESLMSEGPARRVQIKRACYLGAHPVTVEQFRRFVEVTGHETTAEVNGKGALGWNDQEKKMVYSPEFTWRKPAFVLSAKLPVVCVDYRDAVSFCSWLSITEGLQYDIPHESIWEFACRAGTTSFWYWGDEPEAWDTFAHTPFTRSPVGEKPPNAFGLFDMIGNAEELARADNRPLVQRGGSGVWLSRCAKRHILKEGHPPEWNAGFRVAIIGDVKAVAKLHPKPAPQ
ncbi:MAG: bifunctional serine/threonine-protein kinase/formylglycine-generating enzyme family protein, partial [Pirellulales bacterium]